MQSIAIEAAINGLLSGLMLALASLAATLHASLAKYFSVTLGTIGTCAAYASYAAQPSLGYFCVVVALPIGFAVSVFLEKIFVAKFRYRGSSPLSLLIVSLGLSTFLRSALSMAFTERPVSLRSFSAASPIQVAIFRSQIPLEPVRLWCGLASFVVIAFTLFLVQGTWFGLRLRAWRSDPVLAEMFLSRSHQTFALGIGLSGALFSLGVSMTALQSSLSPHLGDRIYLTSIIGFLVSRSGDLWVPVASSLGIGTILSTVPLVASPFVQTLVLYTMFTAVLVLRPSGLGARRERHFNG